jgi:hypothetical protein
MARRVNVAPLWQQGQSDFVFHEIGPEDNLGLGYLLIEGEPHGVRDAAERKGARYGVGPIVGRGAVEPCLFVPQEYSHCQ